MEALSNTSTEQSIDVKYSVSESNILAPI